MTDEQILEKWMQVVRQAWESENFKKMLLENPRGVLQAAGMDPGVPHVQIHENSADTRHYVLPARPTDVSVNEAEQELLGDANPGF